MKTVWYNKCNTKNERKKKNMKKLSLLLALLMIFTCCALASCSEEETSSAPEASSTAPATSSEAPATSSEAESSEEAPAESSEEEVSTEPEYVKNPDALSTEGNNVAAGKEYTISEQFHMSTETWGYDESYPVSYPDNNFELTDGVIPTNDDKYGADCWMAFNQQTPAQQERGYGYVQFDLGQSYEISQVIVHSLKQTEPGITCPYQIEVLVSEDNETWYSASVLNITGELEGMEDAAVHALVSEMDVTGRYVEIRVTSYGWAFMGEIEIK